MCDRVEGASYRLPNISTLSNLSSNYFFVKVKQYMNAFLKKKNLRLPLPQSSRGFSAVSGKKIIIGIIILVVCIGSFNLFQSQIKNTFYRAISPITKGFWQAGDSIDSFFAPLFNAQGLAQENDNLKQENQNLLSQVVSLQEIVKADRALQIALQNTQADHFTLVLAQPIGLDTKNDFFIINRGSDDGISENMPVISSTKVLYGKTVKIYKNFSQVMLISSQTSVVDVKIQQQDLDALPILGAIKGSGNLSLYLDLVSSDVKIEEGQAVLTSGLEGTFPKDLLIGKIISKNQSDLKPFQTANVAPLFDVRDMENVFVITDYKQVK